MPRIMTRVRRTRRGRFQLRLPQHERELIRTLADELRQLLATEDPALERLFPPGHPADPQSEAQYRDLVRRDLTAQRLSALQVLERTLDDSELDEQQMSAWLTVLNDLRLVLGTRLDVTDDMNERGIHPGDAREAMFDVYRYLTWLEAQVVDVLAMAMPVEGAR